MAPLAARDRQILALQTTRSFISTTVVLGPPRGRRRRPGARAPPTRGGAAGGGRRRSVRRRPPHQLGALWGQRRGPRLLGALSASRRETPCETGRHDGKIARELGGVTIRRAPLVELRHRLRQREAGPPLAVRTLPGTQQALVQLTHVLQQDALVLRPLAGPPSCHGDVLWGHRLLLPRWR